MFTFVSNAPLAAVSRLGTVKEAAAALGKDPKTVEHQLAQARARLGVSTTIQAAVVVMGRFPGTDEG
jgi:DNA-binding NarL/FixJ family response regulator